MKLSKAQVEILVNIRYSGDNDLLKEIMIKHLMRLTIEELELTETEKTQLGI